MKSINFMRMVILIFLLSLLLTTSVGCDKTPSAQLPSEPGESTGGQTPSESEQEMAARWENVIVNVDTDVKSVNIRKYKIQPAYSSVITKVQSFTLEDENEIEELLNIVRNLNVSFGGFEIDESETNESFTSRIGKQTIEIMLKDSAGVEIFGLYLYENGDVDIVELRKSTETKKVYRHTYRVYFEGSNCDVFSAFVSFYENNLTKSE